MEDDFEIPDRAGAGSSDTYPMQAGCLRKGGVVMVKGRPCKVVEVTTSKTGKHGHAKASITGLDLFTGKKYEDTCPTSHNLMIPNVKRIEYTLSDIDDNFVSLMSETGEMKEDLQLPRDAEGALDEVGSQIKAGFDSGKNLTLTVLCACGQEKITASKEKISDD